MNSTLQVELIRTENMEQSLRELQRGRERGRGREGEEERDRESDFLAPKILIWTIVYNI